MRIMNLFQLQQRTHKSHSDLSDEELVRLYRRKQDEKAFAELLSRHQEKIYSYVLSMVHNEEVANDIFQETFTKVITKMDETYNEQGKWIAWVMRIAHNATIDHIRKQKRFVDVTASDEEDQNTVHCLLSDGYEGFMLIADNREDTYATILGSQVMVVPSGTYLEIIDSMDKFRNGEYETVH